MKYRAIVEKFNSLYGQQSLIVRSPGRINLLGEHVDYNDGFVMPASISYSTVFCLSEAADGVSEIFAVKYNEAFRIDSDTIHPVDQPRWVNYLLGVLHQFVQRGYAVKPFKCVLGGDIPMGAGLSSSASIECGFAFALSEFNELNIPKKELILIAQWAEHNYAGVKCGIMDQFATMMGADDQLIVLDCRSLEYSYVPFRLPDHAIVLCDTKVKHSLVDSEYNQRRNECELGLSILKELYPSVTSFRDVREDMVTNNKHKLPGKVFDRCLYVVQEIDRVVRAGDDLRANRLAAFGQKMFQTHEGLSQLYEVSCKELDFLADEAKRFKSVLGARMMGGGFGGCTINLIEKNAVDDFIQQTSDRYRSVFNTEMQSHVVSITGGTHTVDPSFRRVLNEA